MHSIRSVIKITIQELNPKWLLHYAFNLDPGEEQDLHLNPIVGDDRALRLKRNRRSILSCEIPIPSSSSEEMDFNLIAEWLHCWLEYQTVKINCLNSALASYHRHEKNEEREGHSLS